MQDIFNDMDKVLAKFSDDIKEVFKNYHKDEVKEEVFPQVGDTYWYVDNLGVVDWSKCFNDEAEQHKRFLLADAKLRRMVDGGDWYIYYDKDDEEFCIGNKDDLIWRIYGACYFSSAEKAKQAIKEIGEDDLKLIFNIKELNK